jgi:hypothetical protein
LISSSNYKACRHGLFKIKVHKNSINTIKKSINTFHHKKIYGLFIGKYGVFMEFLKQKSIATDRAVTYFLGIYGLYGLFLAKTFSKKKLC